MVFTMIMYLGYRTRMNF